MSAAVRSCLVIIGIIVWFMLALSSSPGAEARLKGRRPYTVNRWYLQNDVSETPYQECDPNPNTPIIGRVTRVEVVGCDSDPCILKRGSDATFKLNFVATGNASAVSAIVHGVIGSIPVPFHIPHVSLGYSFNFSNCVNQKSPFLW